MTEADRADRRRIGTGGEVFVAFLRLGLTSFGGPVAHLGYFRTEFVERRRWLDDSHYSDLVALCHFLPGPSSSQVGMSLGLMRAGWPGALLAWAGFTLPSAILLIVFAYGVGRFDGPLASGALAGLRIAAVAVVAHAVASMARSLCSDTPRRLLAVVAALLATLLPTGIGQVAAMLVCGAIGWRVLSPPVPEATVDEALVSPKAGIASLILFAVLTGSLALAAIVSASPTIAALDGFFRAGALVFGGGHVVLPLLQSVVSSTGVVGDAEFMAGYGAAQAMPGPLFAFAAYLGTLIPGLWPAWVGGLVFLVALFAPAFLLLCAALPFWTSLRRRVAAQSVLAGVNAGVVGLLLAALYHPVWTSAIHVPVDFVLALAGFAVLMARGAPLVVVALSAAIGAVVLAP